MGKRKLIPVPRLLLSDKGCRINGIERPQIGILLDEHLEPVPAVTDFLTSCAVAEAQRPRSVREYGRVLRMFFEFLMMIKISWRLVNDEILIRWRDMMDNGKRIAKGQQCSKNRVGDRDVATLNAHTTNHRLGIVFSYYVFAHKNGLVSRDMVGVPQYGVRYRITAKAGRNGQWHWKYLLRNPPHPALIIPTKDEIDELHQLFSEVFSESGSSRNRLIADWMEYAGLRGLEVSSIPIELIPDAETIDTFVEREKVYHLDFSPKRLGVETKGNKSRVIDVDPYLLKLTRAYIEYERREIVDHARKRAHKKGHVYRDPGIVFLGLTTGNRLSEKTIQNEFNAAVKKKEGMKLKPHSLRKKFAMQIVTDIYMALLNKANGEVRKVDIPTILAYAREQLGHSWLDTTLQSYVNLVHLKALEMSGDDLLAYRKRRGTMIQHHLVVIEQKYRKATDALKEVEGLRAAVTRGDTDEVMKTLKVIFSQKSKRALANGSGRRQKGAKFPVSS